ncbi:hypothetical protein E8L90_15690 [Brevibacillus antibioticus]|uniref:Uncharacterized protein n=1 Tax=Brevibacillus antibioticus TaxID=2570228 RepID=A0A4U2Y869_9BACL|nr:hypothetical protein [Brevibacillus antibioticus]TKI56797.1 hypothetical protein E8L90_15690 [Brevibacillus antibioticus]
MITTIAKRFKFNYTTISMLYFLTLIFNLLIINRFSSSIANLAMMIFTIVYLLFVVFSIMKFCSKTLFFITVWFFLGPTFISGILIVAVMAAFNVNFSASGEMLFLGIGIISVSSAMVILFWKKELFLERVKASIYITSATYLILISISNLYSYNITDLESLPVFIKVDNTELQTMNISPKDVLRYFTSAVSLPFLIANAVLRALVECLNYCQKVKKDKL